MRRGAIRGKYKLKRAKGKDQTSYSITVPAQVGRLAEERGYEFTFELTDDGMLYRPVDPEPNPAPEEVPEWLKGRDETDPYE